jgi:hypothetical protein
MTDQLVSFISNDRFEDCVKFLLAKAQEGQNKALKRPDRNVIDPFAALFSMAAFDLSPDEWSENERLRQAGKSLENAIGDFHQKLLGSIGGWESLPTGGQVDVICRSRKIIAEVKNKHNTVKGSDKVEIYKKLDRLVNDKGQEFKGFTSYYVVIIPKQSNRFNNEFTPSASKRGTRVAPINNVREVDGGTFYEIVTGRENALREIFNAIPIVIKNLNGNNLEDKYTHSLTLFNKAFGQ